ncbi:MAG: QueT transporter family protein [Synergistaceae bacterium]|nr:QueT transporter family protein [Synergistaceae bacterium]
MIRKIAVSGMIAALYAVLTIALAPISFGPVQFRIAEALTLLPFFMPEAIPGLFIGCFLSNIAGGLGLIDIIIGSAATLSAAWLTYRMPGIWLAAVPPVVINALAVGPYLGIITDTPVIYSVIYIGISQAVICFGLGIPLCMLLASRTEIFDREVLAKKKLKKWVTVNKKSNS